MNDQEDTKLQDCTAVIEAFGGIRPMAHKLGVPVSTVQGWKQRDAIPENRVDDILAAAEAHNVDLAGIVASFGPEGAAPETAESPVISRAPAQPGGSVRGHNNRGAFFIAVVALIIAVAAAGWSVLGDRQGTDFTGIAERLAALEAAPRTVDTSQSQQQFADDLAELRAAFERIAKRQEEFAGPRDDIGELAARVQQAEARLDQTQKQSTREAAGAQAATAAARDEIEKLRGQLAALGETRSVAGQNVAGAVGLALAAGRMQRAIDSGDAYEDVLAILRALAAGNATAGAILDRLAGRAATGIPTRDALLQSFPGVARAVAAAADTDAASDWKDRTLQRLKNTVSIRRIGADVPGDTPGARIARAEVKLNGGDLGGAIAELDGLSGAAARAVASWLGDARARRDAEIAVGELEALAIARLQAGSGGS